MTEDQTTNDDEWRSALPPIAPHCLPLLRHAGLIPETPNQRISRDLILAFTAPFLLLTTRSHLILPQ
jgi:hypothetical protein